MSRFRFRRFRFQNPVPPVPVRASPPIPKPARPGPKHPGGYFLDPKNSPKTRPKPPKLKTSKTHINKPFQELLLKPSYSSHRKDAHSRILAPKGPNRAKIEFSGPNVRAKIRLLTYATSRIVSVHTMWRNAYLCEGRVGCLPMRLLAYAR